MQVDIEQVKLYFMQLQDKICHCVETEEVESGFKFRQDIWQHDNDGGGRTRILSAGQVFEQAGINFSYVRGKQLPPAASRNRPELIGYPFQAMGVSVVFHPQNPYVPTTHFNGRFFIVDRTDAEPIWWFGGGYDLTPYYGFEEDCRHWHQMAKNACDPFGEDVYPHFKKCCDEYFYLKHRQEPRGIGGLFFDDLQDWGFEKCFSFLRQVAASFLEAYFPILQRRKMLAYGKREREFQCYRRGRYVEFNLVYDRGTLFGLQSGGRTESILVSLPPVVNWRYDWRPEPGTAEALLYDFYLKPRDWVKN